MITRIAPAAVKQMKFHSSFLLLSSLLFASGVFAQSLIPLGTVLPAQLNFSLNSRKCKPGETITARIMQDVPLPSGRKIRAGAKVVGHVVTVKAASAGQPAEITLRFDRLDFAHHFVPMSTSLKALASMMAVDDAQVPPSGPDRGTPWAWSTRNLVGGGGAYGEDGPVARGTEIVGKALAAGVLLPVKANPALGCRGEIAGNNQPQAFWVFSSSACGVYGITGVEITHAGRTFPVGEITLASKRGNLNIRSGSGMLLRAV